MVKDYYVYAHLNKETKEIFYIGKGRGRRAVRANGRSKEWNNYISLNGGFEVFIICSELDNKTAEALELDMISKLSEQLVNHKQTNGVVENLLLFKDVVYYDPTSPTFLRWKYPAFYSKRKTGDVAGGMNEAGYSCFFYMGNRIQSHRMIWTMFNGTEIPHNHVINHKDCNPRNNSIENLECISYKENNRRKKCNIDRYNTISSNKSGVNGVLLTKTKPQGQKEYLNFSALWNENEVQHKRSFSTLKFGEELAFLMAKDWRDVKEVIESDPLLSAELEALFNIKYKEVLSKDLPEGVHFKENHGVKDAVVCALINRGGNIRRKSFSVAKYGREEAILLATQWRKQAEIELNSNK